MIILSIYYNFEETAYFKRIKKKNTVETVRTWHEISTQSTRSTY